MDDVFVDDGDKGNRIWATAIKIDVATPLLKVDGTVMDDVFVDDGLHLNDKGNRIWATAIKSILMKIEAEFEMAKASGQ